MALRLTGTNVVNYGNFNALAGQTSISVAVTIEIPNFTGFLDYGRFIHQWSGSAANRTFACGLRADGRVWMILSNGGNYWGGWTTSSPITQPGIYRIVIRATGMGTGGNGTLEFWVNGVGGFPIYWNWGQSVANVSALHASPEILQLGYQASETTNVTPGIYREIGIWKEFVSTSFCQDYGVGAALPPSCSGGLVLYLPLRESLDAVVGGVHGVLTGPNYGFAAPSPPSAPTAPAPSFLTALGFVGKRYLGSETPTTFGPTVNPGPDQYLYGNSPWTFTLAGSSPDTVTYLWTKISGPGTTTFVDDTDPATDVEVSLAGVYRLRLTVDDGSDTAYRDVTLTVTDLTGAQVSQVVGELLTLGYPDARISQVVTEMLSGEPVTGWISQVVVEMLSNVIPPTEAEFLSDAMGVLTWIEWTHVDNTGTTKTLVFSKVPLADSGV